MHHSLPTQESMLPLICAGLGGVATSPGFLEEQIFPLPEFTPLELEKISSRSTCNEDFLAVLLEKFRQVTVGKNRITLFLSAGFDSRLMLLLLLASMDEKAELRLLTIDFNPAETRVCREVADALGLEISICNPVDALAAEFSREGGLGWAKDYVRWRPTVPYFMGAGSLQASETDLFMGLNPVTFRGRYWNDSTPTRFISYASAEVASMGLNDSHLDKLRVRAMSEVRQQLTFESPQSQDIFQELSYLWLIHHRAYMDRVRIFKSHYSLESPFSDRTVLVNFLSLPTFQKTGDKLLKWLINELAPSHWSEIYSSSGSADDTQRVNLPQQLNNLFPFGDGLADPQLDFRDSEVQLNLRQVCNFLAGSERGTIQNLRHCLISSLAKTGQTQTM